MPQKIQLRNYKTDAHYPTFGKTPLKYYTKIRQQTRHMPAAILSPRFSPLPRDNEHLAGLNFKFVLAALRVRNRDVYFEIYASARARPKSTRVASLLPSYN